MALTIAGAWRHGALPIAATLLLVLTAACTDGDAGGEGAGATTAAPRHEWCDVLESLELPEDAPDIELTDVPVELRATFEFLAEIAVGLEEERRMGYYPVDAEAAGAVESRTRVEAWSQEHCGTPDPFCSLWTSFDGLVNADPSQVPVQFAIRTLDDELLQYAPDDLIDAVEDQLVASYASFGTPRSERLPRKRCGGRARGVAGVGARALLDGTRAEMGPKVGSTGRSSALSMQGAVVTLAACAVCAWVFALWFLSQMNATRDFTFMVTEIVEGPDAEHPYAVEVSDDNKMFSFRRPPGLDVGSHFEGRYSLAGQYVGWSANGRFTPKQDQPSKMVFFLPLVVAIYLTCITIYIAAGSGFRAGT